ncbi:MAG TPA: ABC transporter ATP-binding protein [Stellaceae bacterium]|nr:ABC transporter ATP-binding protein [Stellaceae bacterium]
MTSDGVLLRADRVSVAYGRIDALQPVSFSAAPGSLTLILGPNGAGKTTLVKALAGAVKLRSGQVWLDEENVTALPAYRRVRRGIALVPEGRGRLPGLSVRDNLLLGWHAAPPQRRARFDGDAAAVLAQFPILRERLHQDCSTLSGGEMQMLAIARALLAKPRVLLLDEPSLGLAPQMIARVYEALRQLVGGGLAMVLVEQKAVPLRSARETTLVLQNGRVVFQGERRPSNDELAALYFGKKATA